MHRAMLFIILLLVMRGQGKVKATVTRSIEIMYVSTCHLIVCYRHSMDCSHGVRVKPLVVKCGLAFPHSPLAKPSPSLLYGLFLVQQRKVQTVGITCI